MVMVMQTQSTEWVNKYLYISVYFCVTMDTVLNLNVDMVTEMQTSRVNRS